MTLHQKMYTSETDNGKEEEENRSLEPPLKRLCRRGTGRYEERVLVSYQSLFQDHLTAEHDMFHENMRRDFHIRIRHHPLVAAQALANRQANALSSDINNQSSVAGTHISRGERRFLYFMHMMRNGFIYEPSLFQTEFLMKVAQILSPMVVGAEDWPHVGPKLALRYQWSLGKMTSMLLARAPRRFGKTVALSIAGASFALCAPRRKSIILSIAKRISRYMGEMIYANLVKAGWQDLICKYSEEQMSLVGESIYDIRDFYFYPGNSEKLRGANADFILADEVGFMPVETFTTVIFPLWEVANTALVCISSPGKAFGFYATLFNMMNPYTGQHLLPVYEVELVCSRCRLMMRKSCPHQNKYYPKWKRREKQRLIQQIMPADMFARESLGISAGDDKSRVFPECFLELIETNPFYDCNLTLAPRNVLVTMDPNAGGPNSCAIVSTVEHAGQCIVRFFLLVSLSGLVSLARALSLSLCMCVCFIVRGKEEDKKSMLRWSGLVLSLAPERNRGLQTFLVVFHGRRHTGLVPRGALANETLQRVVLRPGEQFLAHVAQVIPDERPKKLVVVMRSWRVTGIVRIGHKLARVTRHRREQQQPHRCLAHLVCGEQNGLNLFKGLYRNLNTTGNVVAGQRALAETLLRANKILVNNVEHHLELGLSHVGTVNRTQHLVEEILLASPGLLIENFLAVVATTAFVLILELLQLYVVLALQFSIHDTKTNKQKGKRRKFSTGSQRKQNEQKQSPLMGVHLFSVCFCFCFSRTLYLSLLFHVVPKFLPDIPVQIVGLDAYPTNSTQLGPFLHAHLAALRQHPWLRDANLLFMGERNSGGSVGTILDYMRDIPRFIPLKQSANKDYGFFTDVRNKTTMVTQAARKVQEGAVFYAKDFVVANPYERERKPFLSDADMRLAVQKNFVDQLRRMRFHLSLPKTPHATARMAVSGKLDEEGRPRDGFDDDMAIAFCMNVHVWLLLRQRQIPGLNYGLLFRGNTRKE